MNDEQIDDLEEIRDSIRWVWTFPKERLNEGHYRKLLENIEEKVGEVISRDGDDNNEN